MQVELFSKIGLILPFFNVHILFRQGQVPDWDNKDMELQTIDETDGFEGVEGLGLGEGDSLYFTPSGTPLRLRCPMNFSSIDFESIQGGS